MNDTVGVDPAHYCTCLRREVLISLSTTHCAPAIFTDLPAISLARRTLGVIMSPLIIPSVTLGLIIPPLILGVMIHSQMTDYCPRMS